MSNVVNLESGYRLGFRVALSSLLTKKEKKQGIRDSTLHRRRWRARCIALGELSSTFPFLEGYSRFTFRRAACDARDVFPAKKSDKESADRELIFRCNQRWVCPWCSTRSTINVIRKVYLSLNSHKDDLEGMVWTTRGWQWTIGPIDSVSPARVEMLLDALGAIRSKTCLAVRRSVGNTAAFLSRTRVLPGRPQTKGSTPPLVVTYRCAFLSAPNALVVRRWTANVERVEPALSTQHDDPRRVVDKYTDLCRYLAGYPAGLVFSSPLTLAHLLRVKAGLGRRIKMVGCSLNL